MIDRVLQLLEQRHYGELRELLETLLHMLAEQGEETTYQYIRREVLKKRR